MKRAPLGTLLVSLESGARPKGGASAVSGEVPSLGGEHLASDGGFNLTNVKRIPRSFFDGLRSGRIQPLDILVVKDGATTGKTSIVRDDFPFTDAAVNEHVFCLRVDPSLAAPQYVYQFLRSPLGQAAIRLDFRGATVGGISRGFADKAIVPLPPLSEQRRIAEILDRVDALRATRRVVLAQLDTLTESIFLDMFGDPAANAKDWPIQELGRFAARITKGESPAWQGFSYQDDGVLFVTSENVRLGELDVRDPKFISFAFHEKLLRSQLKDGDLLVNLVGASIGRSCVFRGWSGPANINQAVAVITLEDGVVEPDFLGKLLTVQGGQRLLLRNRVEAARANISLGDLRALRIPIPPISIQREYKVRADAATIVRRLQNNSLVELDNLFVSAQQRAFRAEL